MKIEKLTENKIRVIVSSTDLAENHTDLHSLMTSSLEKQGIFLKILSEAEKEVGFYTENCKLLIEAFSTSEDIFIFTITKYEIKNNYHSNKKISVKRKSINLNMPISIYAFNTFDEFCDFCTSIKSSSFFNVNKFSKNISLYLYNNTYYLIITLDIKSYPDLKILHNSMCEFGKLVSNSTIFKNKLLEYGSPIIKKNAINISIKHFSS